MVCVYVLWTLSGSSQGWSWDGGLLDGPRVSLKSGFQLNPWLSSKRRRKMTEVHDMARSPHPAKPFHFGPFVSLQLLIFMIAPPDITLASGLLPALSTTYTTPIEKEKTNKKKNTERDLKNKRRARVRPWGFTAQSNIKIICNIERWGERREGRDGTEWLFRMKNLWGKYKTKHFKNIWNVHWQWKSPSVSGQSCTAFMDTDAFPFLCCKHFAVSTCILLANVKKCKNN